MKNNEIDNEETYTIDINDLIDELGVLEYNAEKTILPKNKNGLKKIAFKIPFVNGMRNFSRKVRIMYHERRAISHSSSVVELKNGGYEPSGFKDELIKIHTDAHGKHKAKMEELKSQKAEEIKSQEEKALKKQEKIEVLNKIKEQHDQTNYDYENEQVELANNIDLTAVNEITDENEQAELADNIDLPTINKITNEQIKKPEVLQSSTPVNINEQQKINVEQNKLPINEEIETDVSIITKSFTAEAYEAIKKIEMNFNNALTAVIAKAADKESQLVKVVEEKNQKIGELTTSNKDLDTQNGIQGAKITTLEEEVASLNTKNKDQDEKKSALAKQNELFRQQIFDLLQTNSELEKAYKEVHTRYSNLRGSLENAGLQFAPDEATQGEVTMEDSGTGYTKR